MPSGKSCPTEYSLIVVKDISVLFIYSHHLVALNGAAVLADVQTNGKDGARVGGEANGIVLLQNLLRGLFGGLVELELQDVDGIILFSGRCRSVRPRCGPQPPRRHQDPP